MASTKLSFKRMDSVAETMPDALRQSRYQMKRCFQRYVSKGRRLLKNQQLMEELERSLDDKVEKEKLVEGFLGYIICSTQVTCYFALKLPNSLLLTGEPIKFFLSLLCLQEAVVLPPFVAFAVRMNPGIWEYVKVHADDLSVEGITPSEYLKFKETLYDEKWYVHLLI